MNLEQYDIAIIGAGPTGLYSAFYAGLRGLSVLVLDSLPQVGGQLTALYPKKNIFDVAGYPNIVAEDLVNNLLIQASQYNPTIHTKTKVNSIEKEGEGFKLICESDLQFSSKTILIAAGVGAFSPRKLPFEEAIQWEEKGLFYYVQNPEVFHGKKLLIIGGGDSAMDWAMALADHSDLTLIHRRDKFTAHEDSVTKVRESKAQIKTFYELKEIIGSNGTVEKAVIFNNKTKEEETLAVDAILCNLGFSTNLGPIKDWGIDILNNAIKVDINMATNVDGIYAAGDVVWHPAKLKLIATGFAEAAIAVNNAKTKVDPNSHFFPGHSSSASK